MNTDKFEKLHAELIQLMVEYHNAYVAHFGGKKTRKTYQPLQQAIRKMKRISAEMIRELLVVKKAKAEQYKDHYQEQRTRKTKNVINNTRN